MIETASPSGPSTHKVAPKSRGFLNALWENRGKIALLIGAVIGFKGALFLSDLRMTRLKIMGVDENGDMSVRDEVRLPRESLEKLAGLLGVEMDCGGDEIPPQRAAQPIPPKEVFVPVPLPPPGNFPFQPGICGELFPDYFEPDGTPRQGLEAIPSEELLRRLMQKEDEQAEQCNPPNS